MLSFFEAKAQLIKEGFIWGVSYWGILKAKYQHKYLSVVLKNDVDFLLGLVTNNLVYSLQGFPGGSVVKNSPDDAGDSGSIPGLGGSLKGGNDNPLQ